MEQTLLPECGNLIASVRGANIIKRKYIGILNLDRIREILVRHDGGRGLN
jgi:hypothetical protein